MPVLVHLGYFVDDILDRYRHGVVRHAVLIDMRRVDGRHAREADQLPADLVAVAAIDRIGKEALQRVREQHVEEELRAHRLQLDLAAVQAAQHFILLRWRERAEAVAVLFRAMGIHLPDADAVHLLRRERRLIALLRRALGPWALAIHLRHRPPAAEQLPVDEGGDAGLLRAGAELVGGNQPRDRRFDEGSFGLRQVHVRLRGSARPVLWMGFGGERWCRQARSAAQSSHRLEKPAATRGLSHLFLLRKGGARVRLCAAAVLLDSAFRKGHAVARALRDLEVAVLAGRHFLEQVGRHPVDELDEKAVGERAHDVQRELVHDVRRNGDRVRGCQAADAQRFAVAVRAADVGHQVARRAALDQLAEFVAGVVVLARGDRDSYFFGDLGAGGDIVSQDRLFIPDQVQVLEQRRLPNVAQDVEALIDVDHQPHALAQRAPYCFDPLAVLARVRVVDLHLVVPAAEAGIALGLADQVLHAVARPAAAAVGGNAVGHRAPQLIERQARRLAGDVPQSDVERGKGVGGYALLPDSHVGAEHALPQALDEERIFADQHRLEPRVEVDLDRLGAAAAERQAVAEAADARVGGNLRYHQLVLRELQRDRLGRRDGQDAAVDGANLHGADIIECPVPCRSPRSTFRAGSTSTRTC